MRVQLNQSLEQRLGGSDVLMLARSAKFWNGQIVCHRQPRLRGVVIDVDPEYSNTEQWYESIPENIRPSKDQPLYRLLE